MSGERAVSPKRLRSPTFAARRTLAPTVGSRASITLQRFADNLNDSPRVARLATLQAKLSAAASGARSTGPVTHPPIQMATNINHDTATFNTQGQANGDFTVGVGMQAVLDPSDVVLGSATGGGATPLLLALCGLFQPQLEQTHLLNADLGGFGVYENLYPMTKKANRDHYNSIERHVKPALNRANINQANLQQQQQIPQTQGTGVYYEVDIQGTHSYSGLQNGTVMNAQAYYIDNVANSTQPNLQKPIASGQIQSTPGINQQVPNFAQNLGRLNTWRHDQGNYHQNASQWQKPYISKREGRADSNTVFSLQTPNTGWGDYRQNKIGLNDDLGRPVLWTQANVASQLTDNLLRPLRDELIQEIKDHIDQLYVPTEVKQDWKGQVDGLTTGAPYRLSDLRAHGASEYGQRGLATNGAFPRQAALDLAIDDAQSDAAVEMADYSQRAQGWPLNAYDNISSVTVYLEEMDEGMEDVYRAEEVTIELDDGTRIDADHLIDNEQSIGETESLAESIAAKLGVDVDLIDFQ